MVLAKITKLFSKFDLAGVAKSAKASVVSAGATSLRKTKELSDKLAQVVGRKAYGLANAGINKIYAKISEASAMGKQVPPPEHVVRDAVIEQIEGISNLTKKADEAVAVEEAAAAAKATEAAEAAKAGKPSAAADAADAAKAAEAANKKKKQVNYLKVVGILSVIAAASATAAVVMQMYADRANAEKEQCLARWETTYSSIIKDENGELLEIDSAEKWSENLVYIEHKIESHPEVNGDPEKANELLVEMYNGLLECISIDTSGIGAFLEGISEDLGQAIGNVVEGATKPVATVIDSSSNLVRNIAIAVAISLLAILVIFIVWKVVTARSERRNVPVDHRIEKPSKKGPFSNRRGRSNGHTFNIVVPSQNPKNR